MNVGKSFDALGMAQDERNARLDSALDLTALEAGRAFEVLSIMFRRIEPRETEELKERFEGVQG
ncbi:MAG TPA: hypothetical protein GX524_02020 [Firmicutes bacterium]|nr:hypothetical protein [Bacillota bacterium]